MYYAICFYSTPDNPIWYNNVQSHKVDAALSYIKKNYPWYVKAFLYEQSHRTNRMSPRASLKYVGFNFPNQSNWWRSGASGSLKNF